ERGQGGILAGQVGVVGQRRIGDGARAGAQAGVAHDVADGETVSGSPAIAHREWLHMSVALPRVPELLGEVRKLQQRVEQLEQERKGWSSRRSCPRCRPAPLFCSSAASSSGGTASGA